ncbi:ABC transporter ATP-binding protein [Fusobacterium sp.]|uniref:ABC transporter ATP-binding protein n=1 Tax=Fusobacterium sp. TaxID=68766 RepID=UPI002902541D|nr:ABC transporter ATP-binding protein [Fusobacterium sp.]MDU1909645.1 ABC transporter ATP-binding protein [Fusobacterium sp.]
MEIIQIKNLIKKYKNGKKVLNIKKLTVKQGEIFSLLGPNGAGKSTLINILTTYLDYNSGEIKISGKNLRKESQKIRKDIACVAQNISIDEHLSLEENLIFQGRLYGIAKEELKKRVEKFIDEFDLKEYIRYPVSTYSGGIKRRLDIAVNMISYPKILFLDEPTVGIDIHSRKAIWKMLKRVKDKYETTIFLTTHYLEEAQELSDYICIMKDGDIAAQGTIDDLGKYINQKIIKIEFENEKNAEYAKEKIFKDKSMKLKKNELYLKIDNQNEIIYLNKILLDNKIDFLCFGLLKPDLEKIFINIMEENEEGEKIWQ